MAAYTQDDLKRAMGSQYRAGAHYTLETHRAAAGKILRDPDTYRAVGKLPDFTATETGTMIIVEKKGS